MLHVLCVFPLMMSSLLRMAGKMTWPVLTLFGMPAVAADAVPWQQPFSEVAADPGEDFPPGHALLGVLEAHMGSTPMLIMTDLSDGAPFSHHAPYQAGTGDHGLDGWMLRLVGLENDTTAQQAATSPPGHLREQLVGTLASAVVGQPQGHIGRNDAHQSHQRQV